MTDELEDKIRDLCAKRFHLNIYDSFMVTNHNNNEYNSSKNVDVKSLELEDLYKIYLQDKYPEEFNVMNNYLMNNNLINNNLINNNLSLFYV